MLLRGVIISNEQIVGTVIVSVAFIMMVLPDRYVDINFKKCFHGKLKKPKQWEQLSDSASISSRDSFRIRINKESLRRIRTTTDELLKSYDILEDREIMASMEEKFLTVVPLANS